MDRTIGKKALVVCGPTAAGKSKVADDFAGTLTDTLGTRVMTLVVDSMQVYREIPVMTNQARGRRAELVGVVPVAEEWNVARHKERVEQLVAPLETPFVLDAGTGMYLNAIVLDVPLAPKAPASAREEARRLMKETQNPRRAAREAELELIGAHRRGSIWSSALRYDARFHYLRPSRSALERQIASRSARIVRDGFEEARELARLAPNPSVREAVGVKEMLALVCGELDPVRVEDRINVRTRRLARRQIRWFDKLFRHLPADRVSVAEGFTEGFPEADLRHDIMGLWKR